MLEHLDNDDLRDLYLLLFGEGESVGHIYIDGMSYRVSRNKLKQNKEVIEFLSKNKAAYFIATFMPWIEIPTDATHWYPTFKLHV